MLSTPQEFLCLLVEPTVKEFMDAPYDIRRALLAALVLNHLTDHVAMENCDSTDRNVMAKHLDRVRNDMRASCPDFQFIQDVANATKHAKLSIPKNQKAPVRTLLSSEELSSTPGLFEAPFGEGSFLEGVSVFATLSDGSTKLLLPAIESVLNTWRSKLRDKSTYADLD